MLQRLIKSTFSSLQESLDDLQNSLNLELAIRSKLNFF